MMSITTTQPWEREPIRKFSTYLEYREPIRICVAWNVGNQFGCQFSGMGTNSDAVANLTDNAGQNGNKLKYNIIYSKRYFFHSRLHPKEVEQSQKPSSSKTLPCRLVTIISKYFFFTYLNQLEAELN